MNDIQTLESYGRLDRARARVFTPKSIDELKAALRGPGRRTFRAGGHSFQDHALSDDTVISLSALDRIVEVDAARQTITVEPGVTWGRVLDATLPHNLVPYVVVTTSHATVGGTLSSDGISRHSPSYGAESAHVRWLDLLRPIDDAPRRLMCPGPDDDGDDAQLFRAVVGSFGYLGAVTQLSHRLLSVQNVGSGSGPLQVATQLTVAQSFEELIAEQLRPTKALTADRGALDAWRFPTSASDDNPAVYSISFLRGGDGKGAVYRSWYTRGKRPKPYFVFQRRSLARALVGVAASYTSLRSVGRHIAWELIERDARNNTIFVDDAKDFLFFMDGNVRAKQLASRFGVGMPVIQQTFVIPLGRAAAFLDEVPELMAAHRVTPTLIDVLYMPRDRVLMSASRDLEGFACTLAFEDIREPDKRSRVVKSLRELSDIAVGHAGRVHLTKNVHVSESALRKMYGGPLRKLQDHKRACDPEHRLTNRFLERVFEAPIRDRER